MKITILIPLVLFLGACASSGDEDSSSERSQGMQVSLGTGTDYVTCEGRNSVCFAEMMRYCGELGVEEEDLYESNRVATAGRRGSTDDPFARAERNRAGQQPVKVRCGEPKTPKDN